MGDGLRLIVVFIDSDDIILYISTINGMML